MSLLFYLSHYLILIIKLFYKIKELFSKNKKSEIESKLDKDESTQQIVVNNVENEIVSLKSRLEKGKNKEKRAKLKIKYSYYIFYNDITEAFYEFIKNEELKKNERKFENEEEKKEEDEKEFLIINKDNISYQYIGYLHDGGGPPEPLPS